MVCKALKNLAEDEVVAGLIFSKHEDIIQVNKYVLYTLQDGLKGLLPARRALGEAKR